MRKILAGALPSLLAAAGLCVAVSSAQAEGFTNVEAGLTELDGHFLREGSSLPLSNIKEVDSGVGRLNVEGVRNLLGPPNDLQASDQHGSDFYNINLPLIGDNYLVCQYRVSFSGELLAATEWRRRQCATAFTELARDATVSLQPISADFLFGFDSDTLRPQARQAVERVSREAQERFPEGRFFVTGHADRLGSDSYNLALSERRAREVASVFVETGVNPGSIRFVGRGEANPVVECEGIRGERLKECLAPNRRVEIQVQ